MSQSFVTVRSQAISLESQVESLLSKYSTFAQTTSSEQTSQEKRLDTQLEELLNQRQDVVERLGTICDENPTISASKLSQLQRHREMLKEHWQNLRNIRSSIQQERNRLNLLFSVKSDIAQQRTEDSTVPFEDDEDYYRGESRRVDQSHNLVDRLISQAWETRDQFSAQSNLLQSGSNRVLQTLHRVPGINQLIARIGTRRRKNVLVMASVIVICILLLFFTW
ncbi:hypothetical protein ZYGR_0AD00800 [Zygosaccharomyces rouxii]|uniref:Golgi SNAP receptor complex member 1 n=2 Tax=Zygosaccharomyces rouxii TaxID=4956 RepID=C5DZW4_ZYGRC|nr:uncharacterized protein ZYRO0G07744g [Zygosaccharomyces rouxii]KAH9202395.1 hypothetical protein LQ764DRAFT_21050 [Zygosaccharomyces rouxii]GAV50897.1 hypothetical protein ZYGR_0AD00800 [Zygosaccharomyces rouxii]CAR29398.1 ZYRO0G07744p [Zygosaccharomyces rouxii]